MVTRPSSGAWIPAAIFISVDLPAPLPPTRPTISPGATERSTPRSARTPPNDFLTPASSSINPASLLELAQLRPEGGKVVLLDGGDAGVDGRGDGLPLLELLEGLHRLVAELERLLHHRGVDGPV